MLNHVFVNYANEIAGMALLLFGRRFNDIVKVEISKTRTFFTRQ